MLKKLKWLGFLRKNGKVGTRNYNVIISTIALTDRVAQQICDGNKDISCVIGSFSRGLQKKDEKQIDLFLNSVISHPNVGCALILTHDKYTKNYLNKTLKTDIPIKFLSLMECNGRQEAIDLGKKYIKQLSKNNFNLKRQEVNISNLVLALECGGSDVSSSICSNPIIGKFTDFLIKAGGTAIVSETAEFIGAENVFNYRCSSNETKEKIMSYICKKEKMMKLDSGKDYRGTNPTNENIEGGLTTLIEKSMGAVSKTGNSKFISALEFGENPNESGLHFMDTPFFSPTSLTGMMMGGCTLSLFAMGVYNPSGNILCPSIKVCGNPKTLESWSDQIDIDVSKYFLGIEKEKTVFEKFILEINRYFNGQPTVAEQQLEGQFILPRYFEAL